MEINKYIRQTDLIHPDDLQMGISLVGAGGIGSWTALALTKMGCGNLTVYDFDEVEEHNLASQFYGLSHVGEKKVHALMDGVKLFSDAKIDGIPNAFINSVPYGKIMISAVDNMKTRQEIATRLGVWVDECKWLIDGRMAGNEINIYTIKNTPEGRKLYEDTLFTDQEASHVPCSSRAVMYNTLVCGGMIADIVATIARGEIPPFEIIIDLKNYKMYS